LNSPSLVNVSLAWLKNLVPRRGTNRDREWLQADAKITACRVELVDCELALFFVPKVSYEFVTQGRIIAGSETMIRYLSVSERGTSLSKCATAKVVRVRYDRIDPSVCRCVDVRWDAAADTTEVARGAGR
jgi:hypothetical protein